MQDVERIRDWICQFPQWGTAKPELDQLGTEPDSAGLYYQGLQILQRQEDVMGNVRSLCRHSFVLRRIFLVRQEGAKWMEAFARWITEQSEAGATPCLAGDSEPFYGVAREAKVDWQKQPGTVIYTIRLEVEFQT